MMGTETCNARVVEDSPSRKSKPMRCSTFQIYSTCFQQHVWKAQTRCLTEDLRLCSSRRSHVGVELKYQSRSWSTAPWFPSQAKTTRCTSTSCDVPHHRVACHAPPRQPMPDIDIASCYPRQKRCSCCEGCQRCCELYSSSWLTCGLQDKPPSSMRACSLYSLAKRQNTRSRRFLARRSAEFLVGNHWIRK